VVLHNFFVNQLSLLTPFITTRDGTEGGPAGAMVPPPNPRKKKYRLYCFNFFLTGPPPPPQFFLLADVRYYFALLFVLHLKIDQGYLCLLKFSITLLPLFSLRLSKHFYGLLGISPSIPIISHSSLLIHPFLNIVSPSLFLSRSLFLRKRRRFYFSFRRCA
jgi:hypothetical protein